MAFRQPSRGAQAQRLATALEDVWHSTIGVLQDLPSDLSTLKRWFDPVATGVLRRDLARVPLPPASARGLRAPLILDVGKNPFPRAANARGKGCAYKCRATPAARPGTQARAAQRRRGRRAGAARPVHGAELATGSTRYWRSSLAPRSRFSYPPSGSFSRCWLRVSTTRQGPSTCRKTRPCSTRSTARSSDPRTSSQRRSCQISRTTPVRKACARAWWLGEVTRRIPGRSGRGP